MPRLDLSASFFGGEGFTLYHAAGRNSAVPLSPHFHDEYLISAQLRGMERCHVSGKLHQFSAGDAVLINPQQVHTGNTEGDDEVEYISLYIDRNRVRAMADALGAPTDSPEFTVIKAQQQERLVREMVTLLQLVEQDGGARLYPTPNTPPESDVDLPEGEQAAANTDPHDETEATPAEGLTVESALDRVILHAFEEFSNMRMPVLRSTNRVSHRKIARAVEFIRDLGPETDPASVTLDELAQVADLSKYHFLRQFSQVVGMTPGAYLRTLRLCHAARMLRTTDKPIVEVAQLVGFADHPSFSRAFARHMGLTPREYQRLGTD